MKKILKLCICFMVCLVGVFAVACTEEKEFLLPHVQQLDYTEDTTIFLNPDRGFYRTAQMKVTESSVQDRSYVIKQDFQLYHLRFDISDFSSVCNGGQDKMITGVALNQIGERISAFESAGKNVIVRFCYDSGYDGNVDFEPSEDMILTHIEQICGVLNEYELCITAVEAGMVGPWGEMHTSQKANGEVINKIIDKFLTCSNFPILVRTPQMIYDYLGITLEDINSYTISSSSKAYRLGVFNDGYLASSSDLGTYDDREKETTWLSKQTNHLPFGGEVTGSSSTLHDIDKCLPEMELLNLSYLNYEWRDSIVQQKWISQTYTSLCGDKSNYYGKTAYEFIACHMGYRFVLNNSTFHYSDKFESLKCELSLANVGFGNLNRSKDMSVLFVQNGNVVKRQELSNFTGQNKIEFTSNILSLNGEVEIYLKIDSEKNGASCYQLRLANNLWNDDLKANCIGKIDINR